MLNLLLAYLLCTNPIDYETKISGLSGQIVSKMAVQQQMDCESIKEQIEDKKKEEAIGRFLARYNSPLQNSAKDFVEVAKKYQTSPYLLVAIAGKESTFGKRTCGLYNAWGYGNPCIGFSSYRDGIERVCKTIMENKVYTKFRRTQKIADLGPVYNKPTGYEDWVKDVEWFMQKIRKEE